MATPIGTLGNVNSITLGGSQAFEPSSGLIMLGAQMNGNNQISTFRNFTAAATSNVGYTPSGSNKFYATGFLVQTVGGGANPDVRLGYADTDIGYGSGTLPTNPIGIGFGAVAVQADSANMFNFSPDANAATGEFTFRQQTPLKIVFPNGKYPFVIWNNNLSNGTGILMFGYEAL